jgi:hypothetical protein
MIESGRAPTPDAAAARPAARSAGTATLLAAVLALAALSLASLPTRGAAQELTGVALGPDGQGLADFPVVLHRVGGGGGGFVATDTTDPEGGFRFALESADTAIYFAALRYDGRMYIGPALEAGGEPVSGYILQVEPGSEAGAVASALSGPGPAPAPARPAAAPSAIGGSDTGALLLVGFLALAAVGAFLFTAPRYRERRTREAVIELAATENALARGPDPEDAEHLEATRDRLRNQLAPRS